MSADNYYLIRNHPAGGFAAVMGFASDEYEPIAYHDHKSYATVDEALNYALSEYSEYGVSVHSECEDEQSQVAYATGYSAGLDAARQEINKHRVRGYFCSCGEEVNSQEGHHSNVIEALKEKTNE